MIMFYFFAKININKDVQAEKLLFNGLFTENYFIRQICDSLILPRFFEKHSVLLYYIARKELRKLERTAPYRERDT